VDHLILTRSNRRLRVVWLGIIVGLAMLLFAVLLWGRRGMSPAHADPGILYVNRATGTDDGTCGTAANPCKTISHTLNFRAVSNDTIYVAAGTYTENITVDKAVTLIGGYSPSGTLWLPGGETIIDGSGSPTIVGDWDGYSVQKVAVISDGTGYKMWFDGLNLMNESGIGLATSSDGLSWTKYLTNPVLTGTTGAWDETGEHAPFVLEEGGVYKMWYEGSNSNVRQLGYATSTNGIDWNKCAGNPILPVNEPYDQKVAGHGSVLNDGGLYKLWYHAIGDHGAIVAYATSPDGIAWTKQGPVLLPESGQWDEGGLWGPSVLKLNGVYWMWYTAIGSGGPSAIGVVTSTNGVTWTHFLAGPVITATTSLGDPHVISDGGVLKMWYQDSEQEVILYAESSDGIAWTHPPENPALSPGALGQWGGSVVRFESSSSGSVLDGFTVTGGSDAMAGGVHASDADVAIRNCLIHGNYANGAPSSQGAGGVLGGLGGGTLIIENSRIVENQVNEGAGGVRVHNGTLVITNTLIADNHGDAGIHVNGPLSLMHVTVVSNDGGVNFNPPTNALLNTVNCIVYDNDWAIGTGMSGTVHITYSDVEGGWPGTGNIDADPLFVDPANGDYHLQAGSPAIDAGTPADAPPLDLDGTPRDVNPDMGAYEYPRFDHDVAVVDVLPGGAVAVNVAVPVRATLYNVGKLTESGVPVNCQIEHGGGTVYSQTTASGSISPLNWELLQLAAFTPASLGTYTLTCRSQLATDQRPTNDALIETLQVVGGTADVWTRDNPADVGDVPSGLGNWYQSPDLWVRNAADGGLIHQDPIVGITNTVYVRLRNRGTLPISGTVDVYWIEPSLGVRCGDWAYIGTLPFSDLLPGEVRIVSLPWVPTRSGHTCLQDVIDSPQDPYNRGLECTPQWVPWDNNVEWRNVNIILNSSGGLRAALDVKQAEAQLVNVYNLPQDVDLVIERMTFPATGDITVQLPAELFDRWQASGSAWTAGVEVLTATRQISVTGEVSATIGAIPMAAAEKAAVGLQFAGPAGLTFEMGLRERIDGLTVGGVVYEWVIPDTTAPDVVGTFPANGASATPVDAPLVITFSEEIGPLSLNLALSPDPGGWFYTWNDAGTVVTATHAGLINATTYTATVTAKDGSANSMTAPFTWSFTAEKYRLFLPLTLKNSGQ
jgi:predicted GH43/DUF377 family glycosyl hydrolase